MSLKRSASEAAMGSPKTGDDNDDNIVAKKKVLQLTDLPIEALSQITMSSFDINSSDDIDTISQLAKISNALFDAFRQWVCAGCNGVAIFDTEEEGVLVPRTDSAGNDTTFSCVTCGEMFCGQNRCGQRSHYCSKCDLKECGKCSEKHFHDCPMCLKFDPHCLKCKGECKKGCDHCGFAVCDNHAMKCDECGIQTCGIHEFSIEVCSYCEQGLCPRCHDDMRCCDGCGKRSCRTGKNCEEFKWCDREDGRFCSECYVVEKCDLCGCTICDNRHPFASQCYKCGIQTCGLHNFSVEVCSYCAKGFCPRCLDHGHGDFMPWCDGCDERSCMMFNCDRFKFCDNGVTLCSECYVEKEESEEEDFEDEDGENGEVSG